MCPSIAAIAPYEDTMASYLPKQVNVRDKQEKTVTEICNLSADLPTEILLMA